MSAIFLIFVMAAYAAALYWITKRKLAGRIQALERDLLRFSEALYQMVEIQMKTHQKFSDNLADLEERIMELSVPSHDSSLPLEKRHQVLALARQGVSLEDISKRLKAPVGEAELILNLRKYASGESAPAAKISEQVNPYV
jgi:hypothetical protein